MNDESRRSSSSFFLCIDNCFPNQSRILTDDLSRSPCVCSSSTGGKSLKNNKEFEDKAKETRETRQISTTIRFA